VRFAQALGFEGFPELQAAARDEYRRARDGEQGTVDLQNPPLFPIDQTEFEAALAADHVNVEETAKKLDRDEVEASIELISRAERIVLCGTDQMAFFASYLRHLLMLLDLRCEVVASPSQEGLARLGRIDENTVLVGFSAGRPHPLVVRAMKLARNRRAATIAVADATLSEVAKLGDHKLFYSSNSPAYVRSHSALLSVVQALAYGVYALDESAYADRIKAFRLK
jgi:DNA-binding MurR/RpiR family transcriptional regulator